MWGAEAVPSMYRHPPSTVLCLGVLSCTELFCQMHLDLTQRILKICVIPGNLYG